MTDLITWLRAQLDVDERVAGSATSGPWTNDDPLARDGVFAKAIEGCVVDCDYPHMGPFAVHNATHIVRWDPARVLAEVEAKRRILDLHQRVDAHAANNPSPSQQPACYGCGATFQEEYAVPDANDCPVARLLALPYAHRPGYQEKWRP